MKTQQRKARTVWRDAKGRMIQLGSLRAVTAVTEDGKVWDVTKWPFKILDTGAQFPASPRRAARPHRATAPPAPVSSLDL